MKRIATFCALTLILLFGTALPASAQANYSKGGTYAFSNGCYIRWAQSNDNNPSASAIHATLRNTYNTGLQCALQMKVSYWDWNGTWYINTQGWTNTPLSFNSYQAIWWVDYNASANGGATAIGARQYAPGCNASGC